MNVRFTFLWSLILIPFSLLAGNITFEVDMSCYNGTYNTVHVNGTWNNWCGDCNPLTNTGGTIWSGTFDIPDGNHEFKFTVDGWTDQEIFNGSEECTGPPAEFVNRLLTVAGDATYSALWNSCTGSCNASGDVTFSVDMNCAGLSFTTAYVNGTFNGWCGTCNPMTDDDGDGVWTLTMNLPAGDHQYKYTVDGWTAQEMFDGSEECTGPPAEFVNRLLSVSGDMTTSSGWNICGACPVSESLVNFCVDMTESGETFGTVHVNGTWNNWCGDCNPLADDDGDGIWCGEFSIPDGDHEFKFTFDGWTGQEIFRGGEPCTVVINDFINRSLSVGGDMSYDAVWNVCAADLASVPQPGIITLCVCVADSPAAPGNIFLNGTFNDWCGDCLPMENDGGDKWCAKNLPLPAGPIHYKFTVDGWTDQEQLTPGDDCTITLGGFTNRVAYIDGHANLGTVSWNSCDEAVDVSCLIALPVALTSFDAQLKDENVFLDWQTSSEWQTSHFVVQHAEDGINFQDLHKLTARGAANKNTNYSFVHESPVYGDNYYRLKEVDITGAVTFSKIIQIRYDKKTELMVMPSVANDLVTVVLPTGNTEGLIEVYNIFGAKLFSIPAAGNAKMDLSIGDYANGHYIVVYQTGSEILTRRIIKI